MYCAASESAELPEMHKRLQEGPHSCFKGSVELPKSKTAVDDQHGAGDVTTGVAGEEHGGGAEFFGLAEPSHRNLGFESLLELRLFAEPAAIGCGEEPARGNRIDADAAIGPIRGEDPRQRREGGFRRLVMPAANALDGDQRTGDRG